MKKIRVDIVHFGKQWSGISQTSRLTRTKFSISFLNRDYVNLKKYIIKILPPIPGSRGSTVF